MLKLIQDFPSHVADAITIASNTVVQPSKNNIQNVVISGLGGSGIGGTIVSQLMADQLSVPVVVNKDYNIPSFISENTLFVASSYSGNTEETLEALERAEAKGAEICVITSGGKLKDIADEKGYNKFVIPGGFPPRAAFGYSSVQLFYILKGYGLVDDSFDSEINAVPELLRTSSSEVVSMAKEAATKMHKKLPIIYTEAGFEGVGVRFRQQVNENAKKLAWHSVLPEMNHNELVGWAEAYPDSCVVMFRNKDDYYRTQERMEYSKKLITVNTSNILEFWSVGNSKIERAYYLIHLGDYISLFLADLKEIDAVEVDVITGLKDHLSRI